MPMRNYVYHLRHSDHPLAQLARGAYRATVGFSVPAPPVLVKPLVAVVLGIHRSLQWAARVFLCEPYLKARCERYGSGIRTGCFFHYVSGNGRIVLGDRVRMDGKSSILFAAILPEPPLLEIADDSYVNHNAMIVVARRISIGRKVLIGPNVTIFDSPGHPLDPELRATGAAPAPTDIRAVTIGDGAWICSGSAIFPGVTVGEGSVVAMGSVVTKDVPPRTLVAGAPARVVRQL